MEKTFTKINFEKIWQNNYKSYGQPFTKDLDYTLLHYSTNANEHVYPQILKRQQPKPLTV